MLANARVAYRLFGALIVTTGAMVALPAVSQAATSAPGIAAAGSVPGLYNGDPVTVQVSSVQGCTPGASTFVATWSDGGTNYSFHEGSSNQTDSCHNYDSSGKPQSLNFGGPGASGGTVTGDFEGPGSPTNPNTISFTVNTSSGAVLQVVPSSPGRVQPFTSSSTQTTSNNNCSPGQTCQDQLNSPTSMLTVQENSDNTGGTLTETVDEGTPLSCAAPQYGGYTGFDANWYTWNFTGAGSKQITYDLNQTPGLDALQVCFGSVDSFPTSSGGTAQPGTLPDGSAGFIGLVPSCGPINFSGPCILSKGYYLQSGGSYGTQVVVYIPSTFAGDPAMHG
jgi:hypothetical protein